MKRRTVLGGAASLAGASLAGCLNGSNDEENDGRADWLRGMRMSVKDDGRTGSVEAVLMQGADVSELSLYKPNGSLQTTVIVNDTSKLRVRLAQVSVSTMPVSFYGLEPGTYEVQAQQSQGETEKIPFDLVRVFATTGVSLRTASAEGSEFVSGFRATVTNNGLYPYILQSFGATEGVPNPLDDGPGRAVPAAEDGEPVVWRRQTPAFTEDRGEGAGALVVPEDQGSADDAADQLSGEHTASLAFETTQDTHAVDVTFTLEGDVVTTPNGYAMSDGEVTSVDGEPVTTATATDPASEDGDE
jgi:hypothetical protein